MNLYSYKHRVKKPVKQLFNRKKAYFIDEIHKIKDKVGWEDLI